MNNHSVLPKHNVSGKYDEYDNSELLQNHLNNVKKWETGGEPTLTAKIVNEDTNEVNAGYGAKYKKDRSAFEVGDTITRKYANELLRQDYYTALDKVVDARGGSLGKIDNHFISDIVSADGKYNNFKTPKADAYLAQGDTLNANIEGAEAKILGGFKRRVSLLSSMGRIEGLDKAIKAVLSNDKYRDTLNAGEPNQRIRSTKQRMNNEEWLQLFNKAGVDKGVLD